jgi:hypothetical protein
LADQPEAFVARPLLLQVFGQQVGIHLDLEERHAGLLRRQLINVLGRFGVELECGENDHRRLGRELPRLFPG